MITTLLFDLQRVILFPKGQQASQHVITVGEYVVNQQLLDFIQDQKQTKTTAIISASALTLKNTILTQYLSPYFNQILTTDQFDYSKSQPALYTQVAERLDAQPDQIVFTDDDLIRVKAAQAAGLHGILFSSTAHYLQSVAQFEQDLS